MHAEHREGPQAEQTPDRQLAHEQGSEEASAHREAHKSLHFNIQGVTLALKQPDEDDVRVALGSTFNRVLSRVTKMLVEPWDPVACELNS